MYVLSLEKICFSGTSYREEMLSTSEIELVETTITVTTQSSPSQKRNALEYTTSQLIDNPQCSTLKKF